MLSGDINAGWSSLQLCSTWINCVWFCRHSTSKRQLFPIGSQLFSSNLFIYLSDMQQYASKWKPLNYEQTDWAVSELSAIGCFGAISIGIVVLVVPSSSSSFILFWCFAGVLFNTTLLLQTIPHSANFSFDVFPPFSKRFPVRLLW